VRLLGALRDLMPILTAEPTTTNASFFSSLIKLAPADQGPIDRFDLEESDADSEGEAEDGMDEARKIWRDMKVRKYGSRGGGSIGCMKLSTDVIGMVELGVKGPVAVL